MVDQSIVYDIGSYSMKIGFSGDDAPRALFPSIVGRPKFPGFMVGMGEKDCFVGDEAKAKRGILKLNCPVRNDRTKVDYNDLEKIFHHSPFNELCIAPEEHPLLLTSLHHMGDYDFKKLTSIHFETFNVPALYLSDSNVLSLYSNGVDSGCSLECGHGIIRACCIYNGLPIQKTKIILEDQNAPPRKRIGGDLMTDFFSLLLSERRNYSFTTSAEREILREMKEEFATFRLKEDSDDPKKWEEQQKDYEEEKDYELPDGTKVKIGKERFEVCEILYRPSIVGYRLPGIAEILKMSIDECPSDLKDFMYENIVLSGGLTKIKNFEERLRQELKEITCKQQKFGKFKKFEDNYQDESLKWYTELRRRNEFSAWLGGSILTSLSSFARPSKWVTKDEYDDYGPRIIEIKCPESTRHNDQRGLFWRFSSILDLDLEERRDYAINEVFCSEEGKCSFSIIISFHHFSSSNNIIFVKFKSLLLL